MKDNSVSVIVISIFIVQVFFDYEDQMKIPYLRAQIEDLTNQVAKLRYTDIRCLISTEPSLCSMVSVSPSISQIYVLVFCVITDDLANTGMTQMER